jgi:hypothetical protein
VRSDAVTVPCWIEAARRNLGLAKMAESCPGTSPSKLSQTTLPPDLEVHSFQKRLLTGVRIRPVKRPGAGHAPQAEYVGFDQLPVDLRVSLIPVHLPFLTR